MVIGYFGKNAKSIQRQTGRTFLTISSRKHAKSQDYQSKKLKSSI
jgi:hypothetical protein